jgi:hypothetical protein
VTEFVCAQIPTRLENKGREQSPDAHFVASDRTGEKSRACFHGNFSQTKLGEKIFPESQTTPIQLEVQLVNEETTMAKKMKKAAKKAPKARKARKAVRKTAKKTARKAVRRKSAKKARKMAR